MFALGASWGADVTGGAAATFEDSLRQRLMACAACHGNDGEGGRGDEYYPRIAGKPQAYLYRQLLHFREGRRSYPQMNYLVRHLSDAYLAEIAGYYAGLKPPYPTPIAARAPPAVLARGEALARNGDPARDLPACATCHGKALTGMLPAIPGLVGLYPDYIAAQLGAWREGARKADAPDCMADVAMKLGGADISAVAAWLGTRPGSVATAPAPQVPGPLPIRCGTQAAKGQP